MDEPSKYGVVVYDQTSGKIDKFVEKPTEFVSIKLMLECTFLHQKSLIEYL